MQRNWTRNLKSDSSAKDKLWNEKRRFDTIWKFKGNLSLGWQWQKTREETKRLIKSKFGINEEESPMGKNSISVAFITLWRNII